jgi:5-formyltetrahydrofolate cyclo-ligase
MEKLTTKKEFRRSTEREFRSYSAETLKEHASKILKSIRSLPEYAEAGTILFYYPLPDEVNVVPLIKESIQNGCKTCFPLCKPPMHTLYIKSVTSLETQLVAGTYGILEPDQTCTTIPVSSLDCIITPGRAFDRQGNRIGRGEGYFDNLLSKTEAVTVAPCMPFQLFDSVPSDQHDIPVDIVVTPDEIIRCSTFR